MYLSKFEKLFHQVVEFCPKNSALYVIFSSLFLEKKMFSFVLIYASKSH